MKICYLPFKIKSTFYTGRGRDVVLSFETTIPDLHRYISKTAVGPVRVDGRGEITFSQKKIAVRIELNQVAAKAIGDLFENKV